MSTIKLGYARTLPGFACGALALAIFAGRTFAQGTRGAPIDENSPENRAAVRKQVEEMPGRNRALMHPGNPLQISGREQGDNDLRSRTPALANSDRNSARVDAEENYRRTLALYENRSVLQQAPAIMGGPATKTVTPVKRRVRATDASAEPTHTWSWLVGLGLGALFAVWITRRLTASFFVAIPRSPMKSNHKSRS